MPWLPIADSDISMVLDEGEGAGVSIEGSLVSATEAQNPSWRVLFSEDADVRVTAVSYSSSGGCPWEGGASLDGEGNQAVDPQTGWEPVVEREGYISIGYEAASGGECAVFESFQFLVEVWSEAPDPPAGPCEELGRVTRNYVSAYDRARVHVARIYANERRCLVTNFNGAIPPGRSIVRAVWQTPDAGWCLMSEPGINGREVKVMIHARNAGRTRIRVDAVLENGEIYSAWHAVHVLCAPYVEYVAWVSGPTRLEVEA